MSDSTQPSSAEDVSGVPPRNQQRTQRVDTPTQAHDDDDTSDNWFVVRGDSFESDRENTLWENMLNPENDAYSNAIEQLESGTESLELHSFEEPGLGVDVSVDDSTYRTASVSSSRDQSSRLPPRNRRPGFADEGDEESQQVGEQLVSTHRFPEWERTLERPSSPHPPGLHPESVMSFNDWIKTVERSDIKVSIRDVPKPFGINLDE